MSNVARAGEGVGKAGAGAAISHQHYRTTEFLWLFLAGLVTIYLLLAVATTLFVRWEVGHPEGSLVWGAWRVASGQTLYTDWREWPHYFTPYGPLFFYPVGVFGAILDFPFGFWVYAFGRTQSYLYYVGILVCLGELLHAIVGWSRARALAWSGLWCASWSAVAFYLVSFRPDGAAIFWSLAALLCVVRRGGTVRPSLLAAVLVLLANSCKPSALSVPISIALLLIARSDWRSAAKWTCQVVGLAAAYIAVMEVLTGGKFLLNQVRGTAMGITTAAYKNLWEGLLLPQSFCTLDVYLRIMAGVAVAWWLWRRQETSEAVRLISCYAFFSTAFAHLTLFKTGAAVNYLFEPYVAGGLVAGIAMSKLQVRILRTAIYTGAVLLTLPIHLLFCYAASYNAFVVEPEDVVFPWQEFPSTAVLTDLAFLHPEEETHSLNDPLFYYSQLKMGRISEKPFVERLKSNQVSHVAMGPIGVFLLASGESPGFLAIRNALSTEYTERITSGGAKLWTLRE